jgi:hypothetical protein
MQYMCVFFMRHRPPKALALLCLLLACPIEQEDTLFPFDDDGTNHGGWRCTTCTTFIRVSASTFFFFCVSLFSARSSVIWREGCVYDLNTQDWWRPSFVYLRICFFGVYGRTVLLHTHIRIYAYTHQNTPGKYLA